MLRKLIFALLTFACSSLTFAFPFLFFEPPELRILEKAYPDIVFEKEFDKEKNDWKIILQIPGVKENKILYWSEGRMLPEAELKNTEKYWSILYSYPKKLLDPADMTEEQKEKLKNFSSRGNRRNGAGTPMFFFDAVYDSSSRAKLEPHIRRTTFLGKPVNVHERIVEPLSRVEQKIKVSAAADAEVKEFTDGIKSADGYLWRIIDGTNRKSFHSLGIAVDILPKRLGGKEIFWSWARDKNPKGWMLTPLSKRWMPPQSVIEIFESEGFVWGGKWGIWDNMHFEYHPELILFNGL